MTLSNKVAQFNTDSDLVRAWVQGPASGTGSTITTDNGPVRTPAKLIADKDADINDAADGVLADATAQAALASQWATKTDAAVSGGEWSAKKHAIDAKAEAQTATTQAGLATTAKVDAGLARDAALIGAGVYATEEVGRAAVADGAAFKVQGSGDVAAYEYRRVNAGTTSTLIAIYPSSSKVDGIMGDLEAAGMRIYADSGPLYPIATDSAGRMVLWFDDTNQRIEGDGLRGVDVIHTTEYLGSTVYPLLTDNNLKVLLGFDTATQELVGAFPATEAASPTASLPAVPLAAPPVSKAVNHLLFYGQSLAVGATATTILSTSQPYSNITFNGGPRAWSGSAYDFSAFKPLVEDAVSPSPDGYTSSRGETSCSGAANYAITLAAVENGLSPASHVILASTAGHGGYKISDLNKASAWYTSNMIQHITQGKALNSNYALHAFAWIQGENDAVTGTQTPYATYLAALTQLQADIETDAIAISGQTSPVYCITYQMSYAAATWPDQALAQLYLAKTSAKFSLATPMYHFPYAGDNVHLTNVGYKWMGAYFGRAYKQLVIDGVKPQWLNPVSATRRGAIVRVRFEVPQLPLVLDTTTLAVAANHGFKVLDGASPATISSIAVSGSDVVITLSAVPSGAVTVRYALDYLGAGLTFTGGASGNLRDSTADYITISAVDRPLYHVCPHFSMTATALQE